MNKKIILTTIISLFLAAAVSAQTVKSNYAGDWMLDLGKSKLPETMQIESMMLKVSQTEKELKVESVSKRAKGDTRGGMTREGTQIVTYSLESKETTADVGSGMMAGKETRRAAMTPDGKLNLTVTRNFKNEMGDVTIKINEIWELADEGKTLKVTRYMETPRGATNTEMYFTRDPNVRGVRGNSIVMTDSIVDNTGETPKKISGGVLNGKVLRLPKPAYPAAARAVRASGAVNVQVTFNEEGTVVSANAVSGHPLLHQAAEEAARKAKFAPVLLQGVPVSVTGVIVYNFVP